MTRYRGISTLEVLKEAKNYNKWIADEILSNISSPVLEFGAGTGNITANFKTLERFYVTDIDPELVLHLKKKHGKKNTVYAEILDVEKNIPKKFNSFFSSVFGINVLEHIEKDEKALTNINKMLKKEGKLVLLVPAKKIAYTRLDKELGHFRRYEKKELVKKLKKTGYKIDKLYFFNIVGLLSWYVRDKVRSGNIELNASHIALFDSIVPVLRIIESIIKVPVGISIIVVARKVK